MIQLAKCFHSIYRLQSVSKYNKNEKVFGFKGSAFHLPLPHQGTLNHVNETLPSTNSLNIIIDSLPSKQRNNIWRSIVDLEKIIKALNWLKNNNKYYKNINIASLDNFPLKNVFIDDIEDENEKNDEKKSDDNKKSMLQHKNAQVEIEHQYTLFEMSKTIPNLSDIEKYDQQHVEATPLNHKSQDLDHLCFPNVFPYGTGGVFDKRTITITPTMFDKWSLRQKVDTARCNMPYLFSLSYIKDIRALDSGIFASLRTSKVKNLNAGKLLERVKNNDQALEASLSTMFTSIRGSREYWNRQCGDIELMDEYFGPATFFLTFSSAEYDWLDHEQYMRTMNNKSDGDNIDINKLNVRDPVSVSTHFQNRFICFLNNVILNENGPFEKVNKYFLFYIFNIKFLHI
jgi:hypothetical protein